MTNIQCSGDWLVEYADGELPSDQLLTAESHLAECARCSQELADLQKSREVLSAYWVALADKPAPAVTPRGPREKSLPRWQTTALGLAATAAAAIVALTLAFQPGRPDRIAKVEPAAASVPQSIQNNSTPKTEVSGPTTDTDDIMAQITRETQVARLRAASEILAKEPGMMERHLAMEKYLAEAYGVTSIGPKSPM